MRWLIRIAGYLWPVPYTLLGIAIGLLLGGRFQWVDGVIEIHGPRVAAVLRRLYIPALALTFGHVVFGQTPTALDITRDHERVHVRRIPALGAGVCSRLSVGVGLSGVARPRRLSRKSV